MPTHPKPPGFLGRRCQSVNQHYQSGTVFVGMALTYGAQHRSTRRMSSVSDNVIDVAVPSQHARTCPR
jgi:hypothetical protein